MTDTDIEKLSNEFFARMRVGADIKDDENEQSNMKGYIQSGERYLDLVAMGQEIDFINDVLARDLLYNWCLYARSDSTELFKEKWLSSLMELRQLAMMGRLITAEEETGSEEDTEQS